MLTPRTSPPRDYTHPPVPEVGDTAPDFTLPSTVGELALSTFGAGKKMVLAFYVEDRTPG